jgi:hypothetical protein
MTHRKRHTKDNNEAEVAETANNDKASHQSTSHLYEHNRVISNEPINNQQEHLFDFASLADVANKIAN